MAHSNRHERGKYLVIFLLAAAGLVALKAAYPMPKDVDQLERLALVYLGPQAVTVVAPDVAPDAADRAERALSEAAYFGAYAEGPQGRHAVWTGAHDSDRARSYAMAACGEGCVIVAERHPLHGALVPADRHLVLRDDLAQRLGAEWPFVGTGNALAIGGAGAWGVGKAYGKTRWTSAIREAVEECQARLTEEAAPEGLEPPRCDYVALSDQDIEDLRPKPPLYPAPYEVLPTRLVPVDPGKTALTNPGEMNLILRLQAV